MKLTIEEILELKNAAGIVLGVYNRLYEQGLAGEDYMMVNGKEIGYYKGCHPFEFLEDIVNKL